MYYRSTVAQVSKHPLSKAVEARVFEVLFKAIADLNSSKEIEEFLEEFLTPVERVMLAKRLSIAVLLAKGYNYDSIRRILRVSPSTISRVAVNFQFMGRGYRRVVERLLKDEKIEKTFYKMIDAVLDHVPPKGRDWSTWRKGREAKKRTRRKAF